MADLLDFAPVRVFTSNAAPGAGYIARFYQSGTTTPVTVYTDSSLTTPLGSSATADASGVFPAVWSSGGLIKCTIETPAGAIVHTVDPVQSITPGAAAAQITFSPTVALPQTNVQAAIEAAAASAASGFTPFGLGVTGSVALLANIDATNIASGQYRFDGTTTGTYPTGVAAADTGAVVLVRETSGSAWMRLFHDTTNRTFERRMTSSVWGAWREIISVDIGATQGNIIIRGATDWQRLALGTANQVLRVNAGATAPEWGAPPIMTFGTAVASTSGTSIDFTGIPATARRITVHFSEVSTSGTSNIIVQIGPSTTPETSGYTAVSVANGAGNASSTSGFVVRTQASSNASGHMQITNITGSSWVSSHTAKLATGDVAAGGGSKSITGSVGVVRITTGNGTDTFDAGTINISWE